MINNREFKGIWIPKEIWLSKELNLTEKAFFAEINSLNNIDGCFANNNHFSNFSNLSKNRCSEIIQKLSDKKFIIIKYIDNDGYNKKRVIRINHEFIHEIIKEESCRDSDRPLRDSDYPVDNSTTLSRNKEHSNTFKHPKSNTNKKEPLKATILPFSDEVYDLYEGIEPLFNEEDLPKNKSSKHDWLKCLKLLITKDGHTPEQVYRLTKLTREDEFWRKNFQTILKLRRLNKEKLMYWNVFANQFKQSKKQNMTDIMFAIHNS